MTDDATAESRREQDAFPSTATTWLGRVLDRGEAGLREASRHVIEVYAKPLERYVGGTPFRSLGEPEDLVRGFFADRLSRERFLHKWLESGRPLRYWLIVATRHYLLEQARAGGRADLAALGAEPPTPTSDAPEQTFHREAALRLVGEAMTRAGRRCVAAGQGDHWEIFLRHTRDGETYERIGESLGIDARRAAVMSRTAGNKFRAAVRELASWPEARTAEIDDEIRALMEAIRR